MLAILTQIFSFTNSHTEKWTPANFKILRRCNLNLEVDQGQLT